MTLQFDCPICEERFLGSAQTGNSVKCPSCSHRFASAGSQHSSTPSIVRPTQASPKQLAQQKLPTQKTAKHPGSSDLESSEFDPAQLKKMSSRNEVAPAPPISGFAQDSATSTSNPEATQSDELFDPNRPVISTARKSHPILVMLGLLFLCGVLAALLYYSITRTNSGNSELASNGSNANSADSVIENNVESGKFAAGGSVDQPSESGDDERDELANHDEVDEPDTGKTNGETASVDALAENLRVDPELNDGANSADDAAADPEDAEIRAKLDAALKQNRADESAAEAAPDPIVKAPMRKPRFNMIRSSVADEVWDDTQPYLVDLVIETPFGNKRANGLIVDSRGWMLTSYSACLGANKIRVTASVSSLLRLQSGRPLSDLVRGVIMVDPKNDLALLSINRRFTSLNKVETAGRDFVVKGRRLIQCTPPTEELPHPVFEVQIHDRGQVSKLRKRNREAIAELDSTLLKESSIDWIVHSINEATCPGAALVDESGVVQAINVFQTTDRGYAVPIAKLTGLLANGDKTDAIKKLSVLTPPGTVLPAAPSSTPVPPIDLPTSPKQKLGVLPFDHPFGKISLALNQNFKACNSFQWAPQNQGNYREIQSAAESFYETKQLLINQANDETITTTVSNQLKYWNKHVLETHRANQDVPKLINKTNAEAAKVILASGGFFMAFVKHYDLDLKDELLIVNIEGTDCYISFPFDETIKPMIPGDTWVLFGKTPPSSAATIRPANDGEKITHHAVHVFHQFGKLTSE